MTIVYCILAVLLVFLNGFFVLVEFALVTARRAQLELLKTQGNKDAALAIEMQRQIDSYLSVVQLGITMSSLGLGWIGEPGFARLFYPFFKMLGLWSEPTAHSISVILAFILITFLCLIFGELAPKYIAVREAEKSILTTARPMRFVHAALAAPTAWLNTTANWILGVLGFPTVTKTEASLSQEELRLVLSYSHREGEFSLDKVLLFENVLDFNELTAGSIMVPLANVAMLDLRKPWAENLAVICARRYSRYPLHEGNPARPTGLVHIKELGIAALSGGGEPDLRKFRRDTPRVDEGMPLEKLLRYIQRQPTNLALVTDRTGTVKGIVTFEDILEEIVGEISDEFEGERPWRLAEHMEQECIVTGLVADRLEPVVRELAQRLSRRERTVRPDSVVQQTLGREATMPTAVGRGVALPHARVAGLPRTCVGYARLIEGLDLKAADGVSVKHVFLILTPKDNPREQLRALARIAALAASDVLLGELNDAEGPAKALEVVSAADVSTTLVPVPGPARRTGGRGE